MDSTWRDGGAPSNYSDHRNQEKETNRESKSREIRRLCSSSRETLLCCLCPFKEHQLKASLLRPLPDIAIKEMDYKRAENASPGGSLKILVRGDRNWKAKSVHAEFIFFGGLINCINIYWASKMCQVLQQFLGKPKQIKLYFCPHRTYITIS